MTSHDLAYLSSQTSTIERSIEDNLSLLLYPCVWKVLGPYPDDMYPCLDLEKIFPPPPPWWRRRKNLTFLLIRAKRRLTSEKCAYPDVRELARPPTALAGRVSAVRCSRGESCCSFLRRKNVAVGVLSPMRQRTTRADKLFSASACCLVPRVGSI